MTVFNTGHVSVQNRDWRMIRDVDGSKELYDLKTNPSEWTKLVEKRQHREQPKELQEIIPSTTLQADHSLAVYSIQPDNDHDLGWNRQQYVWPNADY